MPTSKEMNDFLNSFKKSKDIQKYLSDLMDKHLLTELLFEENGLIPKVHSGNSHISFLGGMHFYCQGSHWELTFEKFSPEEFNILIYRSIKEVSNIELLLSRTEEIVKELLIVFELSEPLKKAALLNNIDFCRTFFYLKQLLKENYESIATNFIGNRIWIPSVNKSVYLTTGDPLLRVLKNKDETAQSCIISIQKKSQTYDEMINSISETGFNKFLSEEPEYLLRLMYAEKINNYVRPSLQGVPMRTTEHIFKELGMYDESHKHLYYSLGVLDRNEPLLRDENGTFYILDKDGEAQMHMDIEQLKNRKEI